MLVLTLGFKNSLKIEKLLCIYVMFIKQLQLQLLNNQQLLGLY